MATTNIKVSKITIPNSNVLKRIRSTPALSKLTRLHLILGENYENVNHYQFSEQKRMFTIAGAVVEDITNN